MAEVVDSTPLLSQTTSTDDPEPSYPQPHLPSLGSTIEKCLGELNFSQFFQALLVSTVWAFDGQQTFITVFTDAQPPWSCTHYGGDSCISATTSNLCNLPRNAWKWDLPTKTSIISEWGLECESSMVTGLPASSFFMGCLMGGLLLATLADSSLGRKNMLFFSTLLMSVSSLLAATLSSNVWVYSCFKFLSGFGRATIGTSALVLATELVGKRWRSQVGVIGFLCFTFGFLSLPAMAYLNRGSSWRNLYFWTSIPTIFYCILVKFLVRESPRWLLVKGRKEEAVESLKGITSITHSGLNLAISGMSDPKEETWNVDLYSAMKILFQKKWSARRLMAIMAIGFGIGLVYYGMPLGLGTLSFNLYLSVTFNALSELPSAFFTLILIDKFNRRSALLVFTILSGICSVLSIMEGKPWTKLQIGFELVSFFSACTAFNIYLIFTTELFPTCVRNSALSIARQAVVLGGACSPVLVGAGRSNKFLCYGVFGLVIGWSGVFGLCLPETKGRALCDTMDEEEGREKVGSDVLA